MDTKPISRLARQAFPGRNELATAGDRLEGAVLVIAVLVALLAAPVAAATGSELYATQRSQVASEQQTRHRIEAVLIEDAPPSTWTAERGGVVESPLVPARWRAADGAERHGAVPANYDAQVGTTVRIWVDQNGDVAKPPLTGGGAASTAVAVAVLLWTAVAAAMSLLYLAVRFTHKRIRLRRWAGEWERIAPDWTSR
ncbi:Rv1733c family protein [Lentzea nigeriaca]|uniref:Rv1733c family protein n=1 Tax=Lentzea nigeriaca TaxID=1128665 RepID=UPI00195EA69D|nr:hypothetical protein [Lentzea nigeriaca]MBM7863719.1 hypothetical protein [Lentzea nigeriaca]